MGCKHEYMRKRNLPACNQCGYIADAAKAVDDGRKPASVSRSSAGGNTKSKIIAVCLIVVVAIPLVLLVTGASTYLGVPSLSQILESMAVVERTRDESPDKAPEADEPAVQEQDIQEQDVQKQTAQSLVEPASQLHALALELINEERLQVGLGPAELGTNEAAQAHAEDMLEYCFVSHWGLDGLKPYMRYSLAGGYGANAENVAGFCGANADPDKSVRDMMKRVMDEPTYRENVLDPLYRTANIGVASGNGGIMVAHHFEAMPAGIVEEPRISGDALSFALSTDAAFEDYSVSLYYDPLPRRLSVGQVSHTHCYDYGVPILDITRASAGTEMHVTGRCVDPYGHPPQLPAPVNWAHAERMRADARLTGAADPYEVPAMRATEWSASDGSFKLAANVSVALDKFGPGAYTVMVSGMESGNAVPILTRTIFHGTQSP